MSLSNYDQIEIFAQISSIESAFGDRYSVEEEERRKTPACAEASAGRKEKSKRYSVSSKRYSISGKQYSVVDLPTAPSDWRRPGGQWPKKEKAGLIFTTHQYKPIDMKASTMAEMAAQGEMPEVLFWVGCAGSFDQRAQKITKAFALILERVGIRFAILGNEESCTGDPARRAGNEFLFQMMAYNNIRVLNGYGIKKIVTTCPHCFNTLKNEYPELGGHYEVIHHTQLLQELIRDGKIKIKEDSIFKGKKITYHDSCYLGRANGIYEAPRDILHALKAELTEMKSCKSKGLCCGAGGAQMWKEEEKGNIRVNEKRIGEAMDTGAGLVASNCPFCMTMLGDGIKAKGREDTMQVKDIAEMIAESMEERDPG